MRILLFCSIALVLVASAQGQASPEGWVVPFAAAYQPDVGPFNAKFGQYGLPQSNARHFGWGIEVRSLVSGFLVGPMFLRTWDDADNESFQLRTDATGIFGEMGLKISPLSFLTIVPMIGVGGLSQSYSIRSKTGSLPFDSLLKSPGGAVNLSPGMKLTGLAALELDLSANTGTGRYGVALRGGYMYSPFQPAWHLANGAIITDAPASRIGGPFFSAGIVLSPAPETGVAQ